MAHYSAYSLGISPGTSETTAGIAGLGEQNVQAGQPVPAAPACTISGVINVTGPATAGTVTIRCRQGAGTGGNQVESGQVTNYAASAELEIPFEFVDATGLAAAPALYTITAQISVTGGSINSIEMDVNEGQGVV